MGAALFSVLVFGLTAIAFLIQEIVPSIPWAYDAVLCLVPVVFFSGAITVPYPVMLLLAFFVGFISDSRHVIAEIPVQQIMESVTAGQVAHGARSISGTSGHMDFGYSIFLYGLLGSLMQGIRPLFRRGRWELPVLMTGVATFLLLLLTFLVMEFRSGDFEFPITIWYYMLASSVLSMIVSPLMFLILYRLSRAANYQIRFEGLSYRY
ncbi:MAG: hypothetical protein O3C21_12460 [Verrucomicrobia bacterium]|nr:hypothetical protein [Verrucomicrobiota bacterium]